MAPSTRRRKRKPMASKVAPFTLVQSPVFLGLSIMLVLAVFISFFLVASHPEASTEDIGEVTGNIEATEKPVVHDTKHAMKAASDGPPAHLYPPAPYLPIFAEIDNSEELIADLLNGKPTMAGVVAALNKFCLKLHESNVANAEKQSDTEVLIQDYFELAKQYLSPIDAPYRGKPIFPIREDESIFISLAAFREHLLAQSLRSAFDQASHPESLYIGAVVQNCFGIDGRQCRTGLQVIGKNANGRDMVKMSDSPPDKNGIEEFCTDDQYKHFCENGQVRALYVHDTDALGPATARFYASKLWGGETYFMQMDAHLEFAPEWDSKYIAEVKAAKNFPKAILSSYPPGFEEYDGHYKGGSRGTRLCTCEFSANEVEEHIIRINTRGVCKIDEPRPTQIAFIAAGFFFARAEFLVDVPFDPYVPWCFMGEEIALSMRAWTSGWDIYAPRTNVIAHQYRPGRLGLPKFWESVGRDSGRPNLNTRLQKHVLKRIKYMVGYTEATEEQIISDGDGVVLTEYEHYSLGTERTREAYLELCNIDVENKKCKPMPWCSHGELE